MAQDGTTWTETDSATFLNLADIAIPSRQEQLDVLLSLVPAERDESISVAELACGEGVLAEHLLQRFPAARVTAFDGSPLMLEHAAGRLAPFGQRARVYPFQLADFAWLGELPSPLRCVISSLAVHHLDDDGKRRLFREVRQRLEPGGALLIADVVEPASPRAHNAVSELWHKVTREQSVRATGSEAAYEDAVSKGWGQPPGKPDPGEMPAPLFAQLKWLEAAGFRAVDCFWMRTDIAVFGGFV